MSSPTLPRSHKGRVTVDVSGTYFHTSRSTLESHSMYFRSLFARWRGEEEQSPLFYEGDPNAFELLLRYMRRGCTTAGLLPRNDPSLFASVLAEADFLGIDSLIQHVKACAWKHMQQACNINDRSSPTGIGSDVVAAAAFDEATGGWERAFDQNLLPSAYFKEYKPRTIVQLMPTEEKMTFVIGCNTTVHMVPPEGLPVRCRLLRSCRGLLPLGMRLRDPTALRIQIRTCLYCPCACARLQALMRPT